MAAQTDYGSLTMVSVTVREDRPNLEFFFAISGEAIAFYNACLDMVRKEKIAAVAITPQYSYIYNNFLAAVDAVDYVVEATEVIENARYIEDNEIY